MIYVSRQFASLLINKKTRSQLTGYKNNGYGNLASPLLTNNNHYGNIKQCINIYIYIYIYFYTCFI